MKSKEYANLGRQSEEYSLIALVSEENSEQLLEKLDELINPYSDDIYTLRSGQLHITISAIVRDITFGNDTKSYFDAHKDEIIEKIKNVLMHQAPFEISFGKLEIHEEAIIARGYATDTLNGIRLTVVDGLKLPYKPSTIAHISCARYKSEFELTDLLETAKLIDLDFTETITTLCLVRETQQPLQEYDIIYRFEL